MTALYGGTFNPVHVGHLHVASTVCDRLDLPQVRLVLSARPPHRDPVPVEHRWRMLELACEPIEELVADDREMQRPEASFTVDTLINERRRHPAGELYWIIGMDSLLTLRHWYRWWRILDLAHLVVVRRPGYALRLDPLLRRIVRQRGWVPQAGARGSRARPPGVAGRIVLLEQPMLRVSASGIRKSLHEQGGPASHVVSDVADYIASQRLYQNSAAKSIDITNTGNARTNIMETQA